MGNKLIMYWAWHKNGTSILLGLVCYKTEFMVENKTFLIPFYFSNQGWRLGSQKRYEDWMGRMNTMRHISESQLCHAGAISLGRPLCSIIIIAGVHCAPQTDPEQLCKTMYGFPCWARRKARKGIWKKKKNTLVKQQHSNFNPILTPCPIMSVF